MQAANWGALELLQLLVNEFGVVWTEAVCVAAANKGYMEVLRWAVSRGCPCRVSTWCAAVHRAGLHYDFRSLALLHRQTRPWSDKVWATAEPPLLSPRWRRAVNGPQVYAGRVMRYREVRAWLQQRGCPGSVAASVLQRGQMRVQAQAQAQEQRRRERRAPLSGLFATSSRISVTTAGVEGQSHAPASELTQCSQWRRSRSVWAVLE
jgi:hypothetical protein